MTVASREVRDTSAKVWENPLVCRADLRLPATRRASLLHGRCTVAEFRSDVSRSAAAKTAVVAGWSVLFQVGDRARRESRLLASGTTYRQRHISRGELLTRGVEPPRVSPYGPEPYASAIPPRELRERRLVSCPRGVAAQAQSGSGARPAAALLLRSLLQLVSLLRFA